MSKTKKPTPYDPKLVAAQCDPVTLRLGCAAGTTSPAKRT